MNNPKTHIWYWRILHFPLWASEPANEAQSIRNIHIRWYSDTNMSCMNEILYRVGMNTCFSSTMCGTNIFSFSGLMVLPVGSGTSYHGAANFYCSRVPKFRGFPITPEACSKSIRHPYTSTLRELYSWFNVLIFSNVAMTLQLLVHKVRLTRSRERKRNQQII